MLFAVGTCSGLPTPESIEKFLPQQRISDTQGFVEGLSELELALLICAARAEVKLESDSLNFNLVYDEYLEVANELKKERSTALTGIGTAAAGVAGYRIWSKEVARAAWERLEALDLILSLSQHSGSKAAADPSVRDEIKLIKVDAGLLEIGNMIGRGHTLYKWTRI
jgi:origin recognition complex subunit 4